MQSTFWDRFILCLYRTFPLGDHAVGTVAALLLQRSADLGLLRVDELNPRSMLLILLLCPEPLPIRAAASTKYGNLGLTPLQVWQILAGLTQPDFRDALRASAGGTDVLRRNLTLEAICLEYFADLRTYLSRFYLREEDHEEPAAAHILCDAILACDANPSAAEDFLTHLYVYAINHDGEPPPVAWPASLPTWENALDPWERRFLSCSFRLEPSLRRLLFLSHYARLSAPRLTAMLQTVLPTWRVPVVTDLLFRAWVEILNCMAHEDGGNP